MGRRARTRREFVSAALRSGVAALAAGALPTRIAARGSGHGSPLGVLARSPGGETAGRSSDQTPRRVGTVPFDVEWDAAFNEPIGSGLAGRVVHDLSSLSGDAPVTPTEHFFVRTARPDGLRSTDDWTIAVRGLVREPFQLSLDELLPRTVSQGVHLLECSGNPRRRSFGLMSACEWSGIPVAEVLERTRPGRRAARVLIGGFDEHSVAGGGIPGASWIFDPAELEAAGAFFATHMNGEPLPDDHGYPVRLFVPGWYGCTAAKWVDRIEWVEDTAPATGQMREYASRTGNDGRPELAREYRPATLDLAAMPVRVERWAAADETFYRVVGIAWGGQRLVDTLEIRFGDELPWRRVEGFEHRNLRTWNLWSHVWRPAAPGSYTIRLRVPDPDVPTRRIDRGYYDRTVTLDEV